MKLIKKVMVFVVVMALCMYGAGFASADENDTYSVTYNLTGLTASSQETTEWLGFNRFVDSNIRQSSGSAAKRR